jgi:hypothetical protein
MALTMNPEQVLSNLRTRYEGYHRAQRTERRPWFNDEDRVRAREALQQAVDLAQRELSALDQRGKQQLYGDLLVQLTLAETDLKASAGRWCSSYRGGWGVANRNPWKARLAKALRRKPLSIEQVLQLDSYALVQAFLNILDAPDDDAQRKHLLAYAVISTKMTKQ